MKMHQSLLMLSLPNSGSTWLADLIAKHSRWDRYCMEFFNPIRSPKHYNTLARNFGCELHACYKNIADPGDEMIDRDIRESWGTEEFNFTKEVFSPFKLEAFARHFRCFVLLRDLGDTFPPKRARIWSFYEHAWFALKEAGLLGNAYPAWHFEDRAMQAHAIMQAAIVVDAERLGVPVIRYRDLFEDEGLKPRLEAAIGECDDRLVSALQETRRLVER